MPMWNEEKDEYSFISLMHMRHSCIQFDSSLVSWTSYWITFCILVWGKVIGDGTDSRST
jgi:hypothetical protein